MSLKLPQLLYNNEIIFIINYTLEDVFANYWPIKRKHISDIDIFN